ncbi:MAG: type II toxin-antitoxin system PemK/MazF family toxin [Elusimicrobiota bacterium]
MPISKGDIVLVPFPFTNLLSAKVRPSLVISVNNDIDVTVMFISSIVPEHIPEQELLLEQTHPDFLFTGLKKTSVFKTGKILTLERTKILRRLGKVSPSLQKEIDLKLKLAFGLE